MKRNVYWVTGTLAIAFVVVAWATSQAGAAASAQLAGYTQVSGAPVVATTLGYSAAQAAPVTNVGWRYRAVYRPVVRPYSAYRPVYAYPPYGYAYPYVAYPGYYGGPVWRSGYRGPYVW